MAAYNAGRYADAREAFDACLAALHQDSDPMRSLALFYAAESEVRLAEEALQREDAAAALEAATRAAERNPGFPEAYALMGLAQAIQGALEASASSLRTALGLDPDHVEAHLVLGLVARALGDPSAEACFEAARSRSNIPLRLPAACLRGVFAAFRGSVPADLCAAFPLPPVPAVPMAQRAPAP
jgi:tetratricopeptide (TPR) repeat protein